MTNPTTDLHNLISNSYKSDYRKLYFTAYAILKNTNEGADAASDAVTDAYCQALQGKFDADKGATLYTWLFRVVTNGALNHLKSHAVSRRSSAQVTDVPESTWQASDVVPRAFVGPERAYLNKENRALINAALLTCSGREVLAFELCKFDGMTTTAAAEVMGVSQPTAHRALNSAQAIIRNHVAKMTA